MGQILKPEKTEGCHVLILEFLILCAKLPFDVLVVRGVATPGQQAALWAKGRTVKGEPPYTKERPLGRTVTDALRVEDTAHGRGAAVDVVPVVDGVPRWEAESDAANLRRWFAIGELAESVRREKDGRPVYEWGGRFIRRNSKGRLVPFFDAGHVQLAGWRELPMPEELRWPPTH